MDEQAKMDALADWLYENKDQQDTQEFQWAAEEYRTLRSSLENPQKTAEPAEASSTRNVTDNPIKGAFSNTLKFGRDATGLVSRVNKRADRNADALVRYAGDYTLRERMKHSRSERNAILEGYNDEYVPKRGGVVQGASDLLDRASGVVGDFESSVTWDEVKESKNPLSAAANIARYGADNMLASAPEAALFLTPAGAATSMTVNTDRHAQRRAQNMGREEATLTDYMAGGTAAGIETLLGRLGAKVTTAPIPGKGAVLGHTAKATAVESGTGLVSGGATAALTGEEDILDAALQEATTAASGGAAMGSLNARNAGARVNAEERALGKKAARDPSQLAAMEEAASRIADVMDGSMNGIEHRSETQAARTALEDYHTQTVDILRRLEEAGELGTEQTASVTNDVLGEISPAKVAQLEAGKSKNTQRLLTDQSLDRIDRLGLDPDTADTLKQRLRVQDALATAGIKRNANSGPTAKSMSALGGVAGSLVGFQAGNVVAPGLNAAVPGAAAGSYIGAKAGHSIGLQVDRVRGKVQPAIVAATKLRRRAMDRLDAQPRDTAAEMGLITKRTQAKAEARQKGFQRRAADWWQNSTGVTKAPDPYFQRLMDSTSLTPREMDAHLEVLTRVKPRDPDAARAENGYLVSKEELKAIREGRTRDLMAGDRGLEIQQLLVNFAEQKQLHEQRLRQEEADARNADRAEVQEARRLEKLAQEEARKAAAAEKALQQQQAAEDRAALARQKANARVALDEARVQATRDTAAARVEAIRQGAEGKALLDAERADAVRLKAEADVDKRLAETDRVRGEMPARVDVLKAQAESLRTRADAFARQAKSARARANTATGEDSLYGVRNVERYRATMANNMAEVRMAQSQAPTAELAALVLEIAQAKTGAQKKAILSAKRTEFPDYQTYLDRYVRPLTEHNAGNITEEG